jgi:hypothetical protein
MGGDPTKKGILGLITDSRSIESKGRALEGKGLNLYVQGCIEEIGEVCTDIDEIINILKRWQQELV